MTFNILEISFNGFFSLASCLLGMAYPLVVQCIQRIDEKYHSDNLAKRFRKEPVFPVFNVLIVSSVLTAVFYVFLLSAITNTVVLLFLVCIQAMITLSLMTVMVLLVQLILVYYTPLQLAQRILCKFTIADMSDLLDVCIYAAKNEDDKLYELCHERIRKIVYEEQRRMESDENLKNKPVEYPQEFWNAYRRIVKLACDDTNPTYFYYDNNLAAYLYNLYSKTFISEQTYREQWWALNRISDSKNMSWFIAYWTNAVSYVRMAGLKAHGEEKDYFELYHLMVGALLVYKEKYIWLKEMTAYTYSHPESYPLVPSTFNQIFHYANKLLDIKENLFGWFGAKFFFSGMTSSVNDDGIIYDNAIRYLALLMIRLWSVNDYNITFSYPMVLPDVAAKSINDNERFIAISNHLRRHVRLWYKDRLISQVQLRVIPKMADVMGLLENYINKCEEQILIIKEQKEPNWKRISLFKQQLIQLSRKPLRLPLWDGTPDDIEPLEYTLPIENKMDDELFTIGRDISYTNYPDVLIDGIHSSARERYNLFFVIHQPSFQYRIQARDVFLALDRLQLSAKEHVVLAMGFYLGNHEALYGKVEHFDNRGDYYLYRGIVILPLASMGVSLIVMKKSALPCVEFARKDESELSLIDEESMLYGNIDSMYKDVKAQNILCLCKYMRLHYTKESEQYIRFDISYNTGLGQLDLEKLSPLQILE